MANPRRRNNPPNKSDSESHEREHVVQIKWVISVKFNEVINADIGNFVKSLRVEK